MARLSIKILLLLTSLFFVFSCGNNKKQDKSKKNDTEIVGADRDEHGCIASAGYTWSELLQDCIRPFEKGKKFTAVNPEDSVMAAYLVFSADSSKAELYTPEMNGKGQILYKYVFSNGIVTWTNNIKRGYLVKNDDEEWVIYKNVKPVYIFNND